jgi:hypothetical protein
MLQKRVLVSSVIQNIVCVPFHNIHQFLLTSLAFLQIKARFVGSKGSLGSLQVRCVSSVDIFTPADQFKARHMGSQGADKQKMLEKVGFTHLDALLDSAVPTPIRLPKSLKLDEPISESEALAKLKGIMSKNQVLKSFIGMGYYEVLTPQVILRNVSSISFSSLYFLTICLGKECSFLLHIILSFSCR